MRTPKFILFILLLLIFSTFLMVSTCSNDRAEYKEYHSLAEKIAAESLTPAKDNLEVNQNNLIKINTSQPPFFINKRIDKIQSFNCSECHQQPLAVMQENLNKKEPEFKKAHWNIVLQHAPIATMNCTTCHSPNNMDQLHTLNQQPVSFNHSYQICAQCHSTQFNNWKGGAHGKQIANWTPPRVSMTCVECHNPHKPAFEKRWPSSYPY